LGLMFLISPVVMSLLNKESRYDAKEWGVTATIWGRRSLFSAVNGKKTLDCETGAPRGIRIERRCLSVSWDHFTRSHPGRIDVGPSWMGPPGVLRLPQRLEYVLEEIERSSSTVSIEQLVRLCSLVRYPR